MTEATCKTCPNWCDEECRAEVPVYSIDTDGDLCGFPPHTIRVAPGHKHPHTPADHWCGKHPVRVAAYEAEVQKAKVAHAKTSEKDRDAAYRDALERSGLENLSESALTYLARRGSDCEPGSQVDRARQELQRRSDLPFFGTGYIRITPDDPKDAALAAAADQVVNYMDKAATDTDTRKPRRAYKRNKAGVVFAEGDIVCAISDMRGDEAPGAARKTIVTIHGASFRWTPVRIGTMDPIGGIGELDDYLLVRRWDADLP